MRLQLVQKIDHCGVDFRRAFLPRPMTAVPKNYCSTQSRHVVRQIGDNPIDALLRRSPIASHVKRRNSHLRAREWPPGPLNVTPVFRASEEAGVSLIGRAARLAAIPVGESPANRGDPMQVQRAG